MISQIKGSREMIWVDQSKEKKTNRGTNDVGVDGS